MNLQSSGRTKTNFAETYKKSNQYYIMIDERGGLQCGLAVSKCFNSKQERQLRLMLKKL